MKFTNLIVTIAIISLAGNAYAQKDGTLRRTIVAQADDAKEVNININTNTNANTAAQQQAQVQQQPVTVVEAAPAVESKADVLRKERMGAEVATEQKIVEKLEDSRLQEEKARADRLFGNKLDPQPAAPAPAPAPVAQPAPAPAPVIVQEQKPTQVTIERVEIIQPKAESRAEIKKEEAAPESTQRYYVSGLVGNTSYAASNVKSNYGLGVAVGTIIDNRWGFELGYMYSNHNIDDLWYQQVYHKLDQMDFSGALKFYVLPGKLKPYVGGSTTYITRRYTDRIYNTNYQGTAETTSAVNMGLLGGVDFQLNDQFLIGAGMDYNFNVMNISNIDKRAYNLPPGSEELEKISYWTMKLTAKFLF